MLLCLASCTPCIGQTISGIISDKETHQPVSGALVIVGINKTFTNIQGLFQIAGSASDSLKVVHFAYKTYTISINNKTTTLHIELEPAIISLNTVTVHGDRDFKKDSINNRVAYAKQFNYKGPTVMDAFKGDVYNRQPGELLSLNVLTLVSALTKKSTPEYKFNKILVRDEQAEYVDRSFNRASVARITGLTGDTLAAFLLIYRPTYAFAKKASEYDMEVYIKASFEDFKQGGFKKDELFAKP